MQFPSSAILRSRSPIKAPDIERKTHRRRSSSQYKFVRFTVSKKGRVALALLAFVNLWLAGRLGWLARKKIWFPHHRIDEHAVDFDAPPAHTRCLLDTLELQDDLAPIVKDFGKFHRTTPCGVYDLPATMPLHMSWSGEYQPWISFAIDSFLATQDMSHMTLWFWHDHEIPNQVLERYTGALSKFNGSVLFKWLNIGALVEDTCFNGDQAFEALPFGTGVDGRGKAVESDILRLLLLEKYGGVWMDADSILLRDLQPLLSAGPFAGYDQASHYWNNAFMFFGPAHSYAATRASTTSCSLPIDYEEWPHSDIPLVAPLFHHADGLLKVCEAYQNCGIQPIPLKLVDGYQWPSDGLKPCEPTSDMRAKLDELFIWHNRIDDYNLNSCGDGTPMQYIRDRVEAKLATSDWRAPSSL